MKILLQPFFIIFVQILTIITNTCKASTLPKYPAILIFGDSSVDTGNNNFLTTIFQSNHYPYGHDFPGQVPTGRFSDGKIPPDLLAKSLGIKDIVPAFLDPTISNDELHTGVSFASAGSGFDDLTIVASGVLSMTEQIELFKNYIQKLEGLAGQDKAMKIISGAMVSISAGVNDFGYNFYNFPATRRRQFTIGQYQDFILGRIQTFVKELYGLGLRTMLIGGLPPMGCLPIQITARFKDPKDRRCLEDQNSDSQAYNQKLAIMLPELQGSLPGSKLIFANGYVPFIDMINNPQKYGFVEVNRGCCGTGLVEMASLCNIKTPICENPSQFLFWDSIHPSQKAYQYIANYLESRVLPLLLEDSGHQSR